MKVNKMRFYKKDNINLRRFRSYDRKILIMGKPFYTWTVIKYKGGWDMNIKNFPTLKRAYKHALDTYPEHFTNLMELLYDGY